MKGLLIKDFYMMRRYCKSFLFLAVVMLVFSFSGEKNVTFWNVYPCVVSGMMPMTLYAYDEREKWISYSGTLPCTRAEYVSAKYIIGLCVNAAAWLFIAIVQVLRMAGASAFDWKECVSLLIIVASVGLMGPAFIMPFIFRFGSEKGRILYYIFIGVVCAGIFMITSITDRAVVGFPAVWGYAGIAIVSVVLYAVSWILSIIFFNKREI